MKNSFLLLVGCIAAMAVIAAVIASFVLLMDNGDMEETSIDRASPPDSRERPGSFSPGPGRTETEPGIETGPGGQGPVVMEKIETHDSLPWARGRLVLRVKELPSCKTVPAAGVALVMRQNDVLVTLPSGAADETGSFIFEDLTPGEYTFEARTGEGKEGRLAVTMKPGLSRTEEIFVGLPARLELKVLSAARHGNPLVAANITAPEIKMTGATDRKGIFRSKRLFIPDPNLLLTVSHSSYYSKVFLPFASFQPGRDKGRYARIVKLKSRSGSLHFSGTLEDRKSGPLRGWLLRLTPIDPGGTGGSGFTFVEDTTNGKGGFLFSMLNPGRYRLEGLNRVWSERCAAEIPALFHEEIEILKGESIDNMKIVCSLPDITFKGIVVRSDSLEPAAGIRISCNGYHGASRDAKGDLLHFDEVVSDANGLFTIARPFSPAEFNRLLGRIGLRLIRSDESFDIYRIKSSPSNVSALLSQVLGNGPVTIWLRPRGELKLTGYVLDASDAPVKGAVVEAHPLAGPNQQRFRTLSDIRGAFRIRKMYRGTWGLKVKLPAGPEIEERVFMNESPPSVEIRAAGTCRIEGTVNLFDAPYFPRITIEGSSFTIKDARLGKKGIFQFQHLPEEEVTIIVESYSGSRYDEKNLRVVTKKKQLRKNSTVYVEL